MKILDRINKLIGPEISRVASGAQKLNGSPIYGCGEELHGKLTEIAKECKAKFYAPCSSKLGEAVEVCPAFFPATGYYRWKDLRTQDRIEELENKITKLEAGGKPKEKP